jgi:chaperonin GroES
MVESDAEYSEEGQEAQPAGTIAQFIDVPNLVPMLGEEVVKKIGQEVVKGYNIDKASRSDWERQTKDAMDLAMQVAQEKSWPWAKAANVKYPLITSAAIQFSARAYPAIVSGEGVVRGMVSGPDPDGSKKLRAERIGHHMSYQLLEQMQDWDEDTDKLLLQIAIVGCAFRKSYFDSGMGQNCSDLVPAKHLIYNHATPFRKLRRITQELFLYKNDVVEKVRGGIWEDIELGLPSGTDNDEDGHFEFLEQHCWYDLDEDGYKEPYVVTVRKDTSEVVRIVARFDRDGILLNSKGQIAKIEPVEFFTKYAFMPNPDGGSYDIGLGALLNPINETVNTVLNQMLDAGTLANTGGGFIGNGLRMKSGPVKFAPGEFKPVDNKGGAIRDNIYHMEFAGPSPVLFQLLGMLIEAGKDISSVKDIMTGDQQANQTATTTLALIEQGQKVFSAIYKRVHRSLKAEFRKLYRLNKLYMQPEEYYRFQDKMEPILLEDYQGDDTDVAPVSDPNLVTDAQEMMRAEALMKFIGDPMVNQMEIRRRYLVAIKEESPESLLQEPPAPPEDPRIGEIAANIQIKEAETMAKIEKMEAEVADIKAGALLKLAQAEAQEIGNQMQLYMSQMQALMQRMEAMNGQSGVRGMEAPPANEAVPPVPAGLPEEVDGGLGGGEFQQSGLDGGSAEELGGGGEMPGL